MSAGGRSPLRMSARTWVDAIDLCFRVKGPAAADWLWAQSPLPQPPRVSPMEALFAEECLERATGNSIPAAEILGAFSAWCVANGHEPATSQHALGHALSMLGYERQKRGPRTYYVAVRFRSASPEVDGQ